MNNKNAIHVKTLVLRVFLVIGFVVILLAIILLGFNLTLSSQTRHKSWAIVTPIDSKKTYLVSEVIDGDTVKSIINGHEITIRLLGIDTPEVVDPRKPIQCYGKEASNETKALLTGKNISIELNPNYDRVDKYGRLLGYVYLAKNADVSTTVGKSSDRLFVNEFLIKEGFAREYTYNSKKPYKFQKLFKFDEAEAQKNNKGLWKKCT